METRVHNMKTRMVYVYKNKLCPVSCTTQESRINVCAFKKHNDNHEYFTDNNKVCKQPTETSLTAFIFVS